ncbi:hypothetical protein LCGC14_0467090 [marine sediment metagenome]|uniref:Cation-transporting P-type ATPase N-terminal domain-containing protein n=1 Tax=marine sediment metagenome TaxID=412755 RepID=A0A0F9V005_9ZZZZ
MPFDKGDIAIIKDEVAKFISLKKFTPESACEERRENMKEAVESLNKKFWTVITLLVLNLIALAFSGFGGG